MRLAFICLAWTCSVWAGCSRDAIDHRSSDASVVSAEASLPDLGGVRDTLVAHDGALNETQAFYGVWGTAEVFWTVGGAGVIWRFDHRGWMLESSPAQSELVVIWGSSASDVWAAGQTIIHYDGQRWSSAPSFIKSRRLTGIWGPPGEAPWVVGEIGPAQGLIGRHRAERWDMVHTTSLPLSAIWGRSAADVWAVGLGGAIWHYGGAQWTAHGSPTREHLWDVWCVPGGRCWAVGDNGTLLVCQDQSWDRVASPTGNRLRAVRGRGADEVWSVGDQGTVLRRQAGGWTEEPAATAEDLRGLHLPPGTERVWVVGTRGTATALR